MKKLFFAFMLSALFVTGAMARDYSFTRSFLFYQRIFGGAAAKINAVTIIRDIKKKNLVDDNEEFKEWITENKGKKFYDFVINNEKISDKVKEKFTRFYKKGRIPKTIKFLMKLWEGYIPAGCKH